MALVFFGTPQFAVPSLRALIESGEEVALVVTQPDRVKGRGHVLAAPPVKETALAAGLTVSQPARIRDEEFYRKLSPLSPEFIVVVAYGKILPREVLNIPRRGCINVHASLLPKYRGAAPVQRALMNGEKVTGITTMLMDEGLDTGDVLLSSPEEIAEDDNAETLAERLSVLGARTLIETIRGMREDSIRPVHQEGEASFAPPLRKDEGRIDWNMGAEEIRNLVRGTYPWPGAYCDIKGQRVRLARVRPLEGSGQPGRIERASGGELLVGTGRGLLMLEELQPE
ncbi:MAG TPA: methionyl-tRNA formyltransferase, partial [Dissulfurispiraceae bacterium]|nr:methionyl-tRNA formyltransferase [Dissulfurispiraceae bacterium]